MGLSRIPLGALALIWMVRLQPEEFRAELSSANPEVRQPTFEELVGKLEFVPGCGSCAYSSNNVRSLSVGYPNLLQGFKGIGQVQMEASLALFSACCPLERRGEPDFRLSAIGDEKV